MGDSGSNPETATTIMKRRKKRTRKPILERVATGENEKAYKPLKWRLPMLELPDGREEGNISREERMEKLLIKHEMMWEEMQDVYNDFWTARDKYYTYLVSNNFMELEDFHIYKMVLGRRNNK